LDTVARQCDKYINIVSAINKLYENDLSIACELTKSSNAVLLINSLYSYPITNAKQIVERTGLPTTSVNRLLAALVDKKILSTNGKKRNVQYFYFRLLDIIR